ncbi:MAG TPA: hypothetical protein VGR16_08510 [Thermomicrobiales bacterium]|nr:hypothetical protein [Thermomicrobiales bacterium]
MLVTHDRKDFRLLHRAWIDWFREFGPGPPPAHANILLIPQPPLASVSQQAILLQAFLAEREPVEHRGSRFCVWSMSHGWHEER